MNQESNIMCKYILILFSISLVHILPLHSMKRPRSESHVPRSDSIAGRVKLRHMHIDWVTDLPQELWEKIIACSDGNVKNKIRTVCKKFAELAVKNNLNILIHDPLTLHHDDAQYFLFALAREAGSRDQATLARIVQNLCACGVDINVYISDPNCWIILHHISPLSEAAKCGNLSMVCVLLQEKADVESVPPSVHSPTPLWLACRYGHGEIVQELLDAGASKDCLGEFKLNNECNVLRPIAIAALKGHLDIIKQLLLHKDYIMPGRKDYAIAKNYRYFNPDWLSPLCAAMMGSQDTIARFLLDECYADFELQQLDTTTKWAIRTDINEALCMASRFGYKYGIQQLLAHGADPNTLEKATGYPPLGLVALGNYIDCARLLLQKDACLEAVSAYHIAQSTPQMQALLAEYNFFDS